MRRVLFLILNVLCIGVLAGENNLIPDPDLKNPSKWFFSKGYKILTNAGRERNNALYIERSDRNQYGMGGIIIPLEALNRDGEYEFGGQIRTEPFGNGVAQGSLIVQFFKRGKWLSEVWVHSPKSVNDWVLVSGSFTVPSEADRVTFLPIIPRHATGKVWFSNLYVRQKKLAFLASILLPHQPQALTEGDHRFVLGCHALSLPSRYDRNKLFTQIELKKEDRIVQKEILPIRKERVSFSAEGLTAGSYRLKVSLLAPDRKTVLAESRPEMSVRVHAETPDVFVRIDDRGRTWVHGRKFFPVGLYMTRPEAQKMENSDFTTWDMLNAIAKSPFNCIMPYDLYDMNQGNYIGVLDFLHKNNKMLICTFSHARDNLRLYRSVISKVKKHPAILAWYIADETVPEKDLWLKERAELINSLDPWHPTWAVYCLYDRGALSRYSGTCNVFGIDPYPISSAKTKSIEGIHDSYRKVNEIMNPFMASSDGPALWSVPQWFSWGLSRGKNGELKNHYRWPTEMEALTQALIGVLHGAKGIVFYSYSSMLKEGRYNELWPQICRVAGTLKELAPYLLGDHSGPMLRFREKTKSVLAGSYADDKGKTAIVITSDHSVPGRAVFSIDGNPKLTSKYGLTRQLPSGEWLFESNTVSSDILYQ